MYKDLFTCTVVGLFNGYTMLALTDFENSLTKKDTPKSSWKLSSEPSHHDSLKKKKFKKERERESCC